ncbi:MAG: chemotaxis protein CheX, partial [Chloroflexota bacterium]
GEPCQELDQLAQSAIGELGNVITGRATANLVDAGYVVRLSPPIVILGSNVLVSTLDLQRLVVPLNTKYGCMEIHMALRENS